MIPINVVSSPLPSSLLYFFFVTSLLKRFSLCHFPMSIFHNVENTFEKMGTQYLLFVVKKRNSLFVLSIVETSSLDSFFDFSKNKTNFYSPFFLPKCCKNKFLCLKILLRKFLQKICQKKFLLFGRIFLLSFFYSLPFKKSIFANKKMTLLIFHFAVSA